MDRNGIIEFIKENGNVGCTPIEHFIEYPYTIDGNWVQIIYWEDERSLAVYLVDDESYNGEFCDFDDYSHRDELEEWFDEFKK